MDSSSAATVAVVAEKCLHRLCTTPSSNVSLQTLPGHTDAALVQGSDIPIHTVNRNHCLSSTTLNLQTSQPSSYEHSQSSSLLTKMSHLISRNPISLIVTLCLIVLFIFFIFILCPSTALAANNSTPAALMGLFEPNFTPDSSLPELDRSKTKDMVDGEDTYLESPSETSVNGAEDYDRAETVPIVKIISDDDYYPPSRMNAKLMEQETASSPIQNGINQEKVRSLPQLFTSNAARIRANAFVSDVISTEKSFKNTEFFPDNYVPTIEPPKVRDLTNPSERIKQLFKDFRSASRLSRSKNSESEDDKIFMKPSCGDNLNISTSVEISSPNYPDKYEPNLDCRWNIVARPEQTIRVRIFKLNLEKDIKCSFDRLDISGFLKQNNPKTNLKHGTKRFCGTNSDQEVYISSNKVTIDFHSDSNTEMTGFYLQVTAESQDCLNKVHVLNSTYITSPKYPQSYGDSKTCWTTVTAQPNHRLYVQFEDLRLEPEEHCGLDYVEIYDGYTANANNSFGRWCKKPENASVSLHSSGEALLFHFHSDDYLALVGYKARVVSLRKDVNLASYTNCNWNADWQNMTISSPFYPDRYPPGTECQTSITSSSPDERIILFFDWIDLNDKIQASEQVGRSEVDIVKSINKQNQNICLSDRLEIWESQNDTIPSNVFCGYPNQPFKYVSKSNSIRLVFKSASIDESNDRHRSEDGPNNNPGFKARFTFTTNKPEMGKTDQNNVNDLNSSLTIVKTDKDDSDNKPILLRKPENASVMIGSSHILFCDAAKRPDGQRPQIIWFKGDRELHEGVSADRTSLLIQQFLPSSVGRYICVYGDNSSDAWLTAMTDDDQCSSTNLLYRERPKDQYTTEGEFVMLQCTVTEQEPTTGKDVNAKITWKKMDLSAGGELKPVELNSRIKILRGGIIFDPALVEDSGFYFCVVNRNSSESKDCAIKSAARVQINPRVDVTQYCGRAIVPQKSPEMARRESISDYAKIIGGTEATPGEFPWMVMFWDDKRNVFCGGALLNERWVMTAAHCFTDVTDQSTIFVKLGKNDQTTTEPTEVITKIKDIIKHPSFSKETFDNDIALIKLQHHITFNEFILPICLPSSSDEVEAMKQYFFNDSLDSSEQAETQFGYVTGWGRLKESGPLPRYLHKIRLPIVEEQRCHKMTTFKVTDNMFCAGYGKDIVGDACKGDSGGPFTVLFNNRWTLLGVVSWGEGCGRAEKYGYYTKVNNYISWIRRLTRHTY